MNRLSTVDVPEEMASVFAAAEEVVARYFKDRKESPEHGSIEISGERYVLVRAASLSVEFFRLVEDLYGPGRTVEADDFARNILFDLAHAIGREDARSFHEKMNLTDPLERMAAGPVHFAHAGWASVKILPVARPTADEDYFSMYEHPYSFEADAWLRASEGRDFPVCMMSAGYSSGWCQESWNVELVAAEVRCRARGDSACRFIMAPPSRIKAHVMREEPGSSLIIPDFFARKRVEEGLRRAHDDLERRVEQRTLDLTREMDERRRVERELHQQHRLEALGRLASGVAHDFNNLMAVVLTNSALLDRAIDADSPLRGFVEDIETAGRRAADLTRQLLAFGRAGPTKRTAVDLDVVVAELARMLERLIGDDVTLSLALESGGANVLADRGEIEQVLVNLVVNARDAMPRGGKLSIETSVDTGPGERGVHHVRLRVSDNGVGMDPSTKTAIFDPFFTTKEGGRGTGLGLSTVYGIVQRAGGSIGVDSAPGAGAAFSIRLPIAQDTVPHAPPPPTPSTARRGDGQKVLLVEDFRMLRGSLSRMLTFLGYSVIAASNPKEALALIDAGASPEVLITDLMLPEMSGVDLASMLEERLPKLEVLFISANPSDELDERRKQGRPTAFLGKPFTAEDLGNALFKLLHRSTPPAAKS